MHEKCIIGHRTTKRKSTTTKSTFAVVCFPLCRLTHSFVLALPSERGKLTSLVELYLGTWFWFVFLPWLSRWLTFSVIQFAQRIINSRVPFQANSVAKFAWNGTLGFLYLCTWIDLVLSCLHDCLACSHFLAILFEQMFLNSRAPFRAKSVN